MPLKKHSFNDDEEAIFDEAVIYKRGEYWQMRMWLAKEHKRSGPIRLNSSPSFLSGFSADSYAASLTVGSIRSEEHTSELQSHA